ncbi:MAG: hypothetical protein AB3N14_10530 [Flavobacteriaceae bacterium]
MFKKTKYIITIIALLGFSFNSTAQGLYQKGEIIHDNNKIEEAYIKIDFAFPQRFQNSVTYLTPKSYAKYLKKGKIKNKKKIKLKPKEIKGFNLDNGQRFSTVKYVDITGKVKKMLPKRIIVEQLTDGKINLYKLYSRTTGKISYELADLTHEANLSAEGRQNLIDYIQNNFQLLIKKEHKNPRNVIHINLLNFIGDNETVKERYDNNYYGLRNQFNEDLKQGKLVNKTYEASFVKMVNDYNIGGVRQEDAKK